MHLIIHHRCGLNTWLYSFLLLFIHNYIAIETSLWLLCHYQLTHIHSVLKWLRKLMTAYSLKWLMEFLNGSAKLRKRMAWRLLAMTSRSTRNNVQFPLWINQSSCTVYKMRSEQIKLGVLYAVNIYNLTTLIISFIKGPFSTLNQPVQLYSIQKWVLQIKLDVLYAVNIILLRK